MKKKRFLVRMFAALAGVIVVWLLFFGLPPSLVLSAADFGSYNRLLNSEDFAGPAVGIAAVEPDQMKAFRAIAAHHRGGTVFKYVLLRGTLAAKLYALVGLRRTNPAFLWVVVQPFRLLPGEVDTIFGCVGQSVAVQEVVEGDGNPVRLRRDETLAQWWQRRKPGAEMNLDILGGGYTSMFLDWDDLIRPIA